MTRAAVGIGDVVRALEALQPRGRAIDTLAEICGLALTADSGAPLDIPRPEDFDDLGDEFKEDDGLGEPEDLDLEMPDALPPGVRRLPPVRQGKPPSTSVGDPLGGAALDQGSKRRRFQGLLAERDAAELVCSAASLPAPTDKVHVERVAEELARAKPLLTLPRIHVPSMALGAQVLIDVGESMQPFREDQEDLLRRFRSTIREHLHVRYFADDPTLGAGRERRRIGWNPWAPPRAGAPVIVLSELGCGFPRRPRATRAWILLSEKLQRRGSRLVVFAPVRSDRLPLQLRQVAEILVWDRSTGRRSVAHLRRALDV